MKRKTPSKKATAAQSKRIRGNDSDSAASRPAAMDPSDGPPENPASSDGDDYCYNLVKVEDTADPPDFKYYFNRDGFGPINPLHDIPLYADKEAGILNMVVEIPRGTNAKLEIKTKEALAPIVQDRKKGKPRCKL